MGIAEKIAFKKRVKLIIPVADKVIANMGCSKSWDMLIAKFKAVYPSEWKQKLNNFLGNVTEKNLNFRHDLDDVWLIKSMEDEFLDKMMSGQIYCRRSEEFREMENDPRADPEDERPFKDTIIPYTVLEGNKTLSASSNPNGVESLKFTTQSYGEKSQVTIGDVKVQEGGMHHVFCMSSIGKSSVNEFFKIYDKKKFKGKKVLVIKNAKEFIARFKKSRSKSFEYGFVSYVPNHITALVDIVPPFIKRIDPYAKEFEFRIVFSGIEFNKIDTVEIGNISDIAQVVTIDKLEDMVRSNFIK